MKLKECLATFENVWIGEMKIPLGISYPRISRLFLDKASTSTFFINLAETFFLLSHFNDTHACEEKSDDDCHETVDGRKDVIKGKISFACDGAHTWSGISGASAKACVDA